MAVRVAGLLCTLAITAGAAHADAPPPTPAPPDLSWYGADAAAPLPDQTPRIRHIVQRGGLFMLGGATYIGSALNARLDLGVPAPIGAAPRLRVVLVTEGTFGSDADTTLRRTLAISPAAQYEWHLPFEMKRAELVVIASAGIRRTTLWLKQPDAPFYPSAWESLTTYAWRLTAGVEYRNRNGLIVSAQPVSAVVPFGDAQPPTPRWMEPKPTDQYGVALVAGYQFQ